ncbi:hypothetical protein HR12_08390 [Microbacterium sp. SUBG005]|nr:hypothetical protein HR12_40055 [Microbacterium sp. SUBG005]KEP74544.1 hypothetical protein HR12_08390 [Microbacterium sp. SUBG005]
MKAAHDGQAPTCLDVRVAADEPLPGVCGVTTLEQHDLDVRSEINQLEHRRNPLIEFGCLRRTIDVPGIRVPRQKIRGGEADCFEELSLQLRRTIVILDADESTANAVAGCRTRIAEDAKDSCVHATV